MYKAKQAVLESKIDYVKIEINGTLEVVCAHKYGYYEQVMTQLACSEQKSATKKWWLTGSLYHFTYQRMSLKGCHQGLPSFPQLFHQC
jgi:hypothetical protein